MYFFSCFLKIFCSLKRKNFVIIIIIISILIDEGGNHSNFYFNCYSFGVISGTTHALAPITMFEWISFFLNKILNNKIKRYLIMTTSSFFWKKKSKWLSHFDLLIYWMFSCVRFSLCVFASFNLVICCCCYFCMSHPNQSKCKFFLHL